MAQPAQTTSDIQPPTARDYLLAAVDGAPGMGPALTRAGLSALSWLHRGGLEIELATYALGLARVTTLPAEVIAVGNLSMGGTGKTLAVQRLARIYLDAGKRVAILSRGYRRQAREETAVIITAGEPPPVTPREIGDEPYLLASSLPGVPVLVGKNRRSTGRQAIEMFGAKVLLLDDGFQYWRLHKDHEIVLLDALQPAGRDHLLPRGLFREPWSHLRRAHEVWITHARLAPPERVRQLAQQVSRYAPKAVIRCTEHRPLRLRTPLGQQAPLESLQDTRVLALSGLGNPYQFEMMLASLGAQPIPCRFPDHHPYAADDLEAIQRRLEPGMMVVTTAKDAVRMPAALPFPLWIVDVELADVSMPG